MSTVTEPAATRRGTRTRADALRNRERIVAAARDAIVEHGPEVPLDEIARRAGIGNATLYRHFADRHALVHEVLLSVVVRSAQHAEEAAEEEADPFTGLCRFAHSAVDEKAGSLCAMFVASMERYDSPEMRAACDRFSAAVDRLMERARQAGKLRDDVTFGDLMVMIAQLSRPLPGVTCHGFDVHRHLQLCLDGLRTRGPSPSAPESASPSTTLDTPSPNQAG
ncbi:TetR/AcrR family transcriptional regulator [Streptomyces sp. HPF1205]|uniref:TetR/AcrR family transcriptional regulator n=1 Tax=Streptomyces sp. HPF1205 TaxID=2873262 RepID=UPI001CECA8A0|nr:TetR/AcrR family transcriptional regulator [Streptomyces sp. HPF1205]